MGKHFGKFINGVNFGSLSAAPTINVTDGDVYYDSTLLSHRFRQNGAWVTPLSNASQSSHSPGWGNLSTAPVTGVSDGDVYYDTVLGRHFFRENGSWIAILTSSEYDNGSSVAKTTINLSNGANQKLLLVAPSTTILFTGGTTGVPVNLRLVYNGDGGQTVNWTSDAKWASDAVVATTSTQNYRYSQELYTVTPMGANGDYAITRTVGNLSGIMTGNVTDIALGASQGVHGGAVTFGNGVWYPWGPNDQGNLGIGTAGSTTTAFYYGPSEAFPIAGGRSFSQVSYSAELPTNGPKTAFAAIEGSTGYAFGWGYTDGSTSNAAGDGTFTGRSSPVSVSGGRSYTKITSGTTVCAIEGSTGNAYCWGGGISGQLGNGGTNNSNAPVSVLGGRSFSKIRTGGGGGTLSGVTIAIETSTGLAWAWGLGTNGQLGNNAAASANSPVSVFGGRSVSDIACAANNSVGYIEASTGNAYCWGVNLFGALGVNDGVTHSSPTSVVGGRSFTQLVAYSRGFFGLEGSTGRVWGWGCNSSGSSYGGQLADGSNTDRSSPVSLTGGRSFTKIGGSGEGGYGIEGSTGNAYIWGATMSLGAIYQPAIGATNGIQSFCQIFSPTPIKPDRIGNRIWLTNKSVPTYGIGGTTATSSVVVIESSTGNAYSWGDNTGGILGDNTTTARNSPASVVGARSFSQVMVGLCSLGLEASTGNAYAWGSNTQGWVGDSSVTSRSSPTSVFGGRSFSKITIAILNGGANNAAHGAIEGNTGRAYTWGGNVSGQIGDSTTANKSSPTSVVGARSFSMLASGSATMGGIEGSTGNAYCWGIGTSGQLGTNAVASASSPVSVVGGRSFVYISMADVYGAAIEGSTGNAYCWGSNPNGNLGNNSVTNSSSPVSVVGAKSFVAIAAGGPSGGNGITTFGIEGSTGRLYAWGAGDTIGYFSSVSASSPVLVSGNRSYTSVRQGYGGGNSEMTIVAQDSLGGLYFWGCNVSNVFLSVTAATSNPVLLTRFPF